MTDDVKLFPSRLQTISKFSENFQVLFDLNMFIPLIWTFDWKGKVLKLTFAWG